MLKINTKQLLTKFNGEPLKDRGEDIEVGYVISNILSEKTSNPTLAWILGRKFSKEDLVELKAEEVVFIKEQINKNAMSKEGWLTSLVAGQLLEILDGGEK